MEQHWRAIFFPKSVAVVGVSGARRAIGNMYFEALLRAGFPNPVYPVGLEGEEYQGKRLYKNLREIPGEIEYVIVAIPRERVLELLDDCRAKGAKAVQFFTAGFSETGEEYGKKLEEEILRKAREGGFRIIGPNCVGISCTKSRLVFFAVNAEMPEGKVAFLAQSGGNAEKMVKEGQLKGLRFSKVISYGNGCDLDSPDYLEFLSHDPDTEIIGIYIEGARNGRRFFELLREISLKKPVAVWKGGRTEAGAGSAASHTGSLAGSPQVWSAMIAQAGAIEAKGMGEMLDLLLAFQFLGRVEGKRAALITGLVDGGGGMGVAGSDACMEQGLQMPALSPQTQKRLREVLPLVGSIFRNPADISQARTNAEKIRVAVEAIAKDPEIDLIIIGDDIATLVDFASEELALEVLNQFVNIRDRHQKPVVGLSSLKTPGYRERTKAEELLIESGIPLFPTIERAALALSRLIDYWNSRKEKHATKL